MAKRFMGSWLAIAVLMSPVALLARAQAPSSGGAGASADVEAIKAVEHDVESAFQRADTAFLKSTLGEDFSFTHATGTSAGKADTLSTFAKPGNFVSRQLTAVGVEVHGNVAVTNGRIEVRSAAPREYTVCYMRLYERRAGQWRLLSHRTFREGNGFAETCAPR